MKVPAVTNLHEVYRKTPPGRFQGSHNGSQPVTTGHKLPTGPKRQHIPPVTAGHKCLRGPRPSASRPPRGVANARGAAAPARSARLNAPRMPTGPQPQNLLPVTTGHKRPQVLSPGAFRPPQRVTNCPRGLSPSAFRLSQLADLPTCRVDFPISRPTDLTACQRVRVALQQDGFCMDVAAFSKKSN